MSARHTFFINENEWAASYVILYARGDRLGKANSAIGVTAATMPIYAGPYMFYYTQHQEVRATIWTAPGGRVQLLAKRYELRVVGEERR